MQSPDDNAEGHVELLYRHVYHKPKEEDKERVVLSIPYGVIRDNIRSREVISASQKRKRDEDDNARGEEEDEELAAALQQATKRARSSAIAA